MNKIKYIVIAVIISILFIPNVYAKESIEIKSIELEETGEMLFYNPYSLFHHK